MFFSEVWNSVPAGSLLHVRLTPDAGVGLTGSHAVETPNGPVLKGPVMLAHFPLVIPINAGEHHTVKFDVLFAGAPATIDLVAEVKDAGGNPFGQPAPFTGKVSAQAKVLTVKLFANG